MSIRSRHWTMFQYKVYEHIENYTIPQYGDAPDDYVEQWTAEQCLLAAGKYIMRFGIRRCIARSKCFS